MSCAAESWIVEPTGRLRTAGVKPTGWSFWTHGYGIEPYEGPASVMAPGVNGTSQQKKDEKIDQLYAALTTTMDEGKRKQIFADFQKHMYDNAVATKAGVTTSTRR